MKKAFLLVLFSLISFITFSQTIARSNKNRFGVYDTYFQKWRFKDFVYSDISIRFEPGLFVLDDENNSRYKVVEPKGEKINESSKYTTWVCVDEKGRNCTVQLISLFEEEQNLLSVIYDTVCYVYYITDVKKYNQN